MNATQPTIKERSILYKAEMVRAVLAKRKTQTRRIVKPQPAFVHDGHEGKGTQYPYRYDPDTTFKGWDSERHTRIHCPYGSAGTHLYVKETYCTEARYDHLSPKRIPKKAKIWYAADGEKPEGFGRVRQSIFLCRWMSRILLEIVSVRCERLAEIRGRDCIAEGIELWSVDNYPALDHGIDWETTELKRAYRKLWEGINGAGSWDANTWVWVIEFKVIRTTREELGENIDASSVRAS